jgi:hypothetical protein
VKRYLLLALAGLLLGLATGFFHDFLEYLDAQPDPFSCHDHWYDLVLIIPELFCLPGTFLDFWIYNPPDGNYADGWENCNPIAPLNGLFWMVFLPVISLLLKGCARLRSRIETDPSTSSG